MGVTNINQTKDGGADGGACNFFIAGGEEGGRRMRRSKLGAMSPGTVKKPAPYRTKKEDWIVGYPVGEGGCGGGQIVGRE